MHTPPVHCCILYPQVFTELLFGIRSPVTVTMWVRRTRPSEWAVLLVPSGRSWHGKSARNWTSGVQRTNNFAKVLGEGNHLGCVETLFIATKGWWKVRLQVQLVAQLPRQNPWSPSVPCYNVVKVLRLEHIRHTGTVPYAIVCSLIQTGVQGVGDEVPLVRTNRQHSAQVEPLNIVYHTIVLLPKHTGISHPHRLRSSKQFAKDSKHSYPAP